MTFEFRELLVEKFNGFLCLCSFALNVLANILCADFVKRAPQATTVTAFEGDIDYVRLLALLAELYAFLQALSRGEGRRPRDKKFGTWFPVDPRNHQRDSAARHLLTEHLASSARQWLRKARVRDRVMVIGLRSDREGLLIFECRGHIELSNVDSFGARNVAPHAQKARV
ncbi:hypothetical protein D3C71_1598160 [compost metagenome]